MYFVPFCSSKAITDSSQHWFFFFCVHVQRYQMLHSSSWESLALPSHCEPHNLQCDVKIIRALNLVVVVTGYKLGSINQTHPKNFSLDIHDSIFNSRYEARQYLKCGCQENLVTFELLTWIHISVWVTHVSWSPVKKKFGDCQAKCSQLVVRNYLTGTYQIVDQGPRGHLLK